MATFLYSSSWSLDLRSESVGGDKAVVSFEARVRSLDFISLVLGGWLCVFDASTLSKADVRRMEVSAEGLKD